MNVFVHSKERLSVESEDSLTNLTKTSQCDGATAVRDADREVVGRHTLFKLTLASLTIVASA